MGLTDGEEAPHHDHGSVVCPRHAAINAWVRHQPHIGGRELLVDEFHAAAELKRGKEGHHGRRDHKTSLNDVRNHDTSNAASNAVGDYRDPHDHDTQPFGSSRIGGEDDPAADGLRTHHWDKENNHDDGQKATHSYGFIAVGKIVRHGKHPIFVAKPNETPANQQCGNEHTEHDAGNGH